MKKRIIFVCVAALSGLCMFVAGLPKLRLPTQIKQGLTASEPNTITITKTTNQLVTEKGWTVSSGNDISLYTSFELDNVVTISTSGNPNCGSIWGSDTHDWRLYQNKGGNVTASVPNGYSLKSVKFTYKTSDSGTLKNGSETVGTGTEVNCTGSTKTLTVGNTGTKTTGQVKITAFEVKYQKEVSQYTVSFDSKGGTSVDDQTINEGGKVTEPAAPTREHYNFIGWFKDEGYITAWNFAEDTVTENVTLYAKWEEMDIFEVNFYLDELKTPYSGGVYDDILYADQKVTKPTDPEKDGYIFQGWFEEGAVEEYDFDLNISKNLELYAHFIEEVEYTVTYVYNNGEPNGSGKIYKGVGFEAPVDPVKASDTTYNYTFDAWCSDEKLQVKYDFSTPVTGNLTLYARYIATKISEDEVSSTPTRVKLSYTYYKNYSYEESVDFSTKGYTNGSEVTSYQGTAFSIAFEGGKYYDTGTAIRVYSGKTFTVNSENTITRIVLTFGTGDNNNEISSEEGVYSNGTWTGSSSSITFSIGGSSGHRRIKSILVNYSTNIPKDKNDIPAYTYSDVKLNYGAIISKANYNDIFEGATTKAIGVAFARTSKIGNSLKEEIEQTYVGIQEVVPSEKQPLPTDENGNLDAEGDYYSWSVSLMVPTVDGEANYTTQFLTENITAVAYMKVDGRYVFFGERTESVASAAEKYKNHPIYTSGTDSFKGSIDALAALLD